ncbi:MAG: hypothetical protein AAFN77_01985 [Planctomycetota bacterium]
MLDLLSTSLVAQRARFQDFFSSQPPSLPAPPTTLNNGVLSQPPTIVNGQGLPRIITPQFPNNGIVGSPQNFTPLPQVNPATVPGQAFPAFPRAIDPGVVFPDPRNQAQPAFPIQPGATFQQPGFGPQGVSPIQPNRWPYEGTGANWLPPSDWTWPQQAWSSFRNQFLPRVLERPRARQTWIVGDNDNQLNINELELATTATIPNFLGSTQPLRISPGFIWHWLDGPDSAVVPGFDLPPRVYSAYLAFDHMTNPANNFGLENNFTIGVYSDFDNTSSNSLRLTGKLVGWSRINDYTVGKLGVEYFDRVNVKILPAFGIYMAPNSDIRWDLYFPRTKLAHRWPNLGDFEVWGYIGAEYGGGSWAIDRSNGTPDQVDINDVRSFLGFEWMGPRRVTGFMEIGYVFEREIIYRSAPNNGLKLEDAFMWRSGLAF